MLRIYPPPLRSAPPRASPWGGDLFSPALQGDIVKLIDGSRNTVVEYIYDTWGKVLSCTGTLASSLGAKQPFRYRGYVYDTETGWYYLQSRYYDPETCRFISADVLLSTGQGVLGHNSFVYCLNNPVNMSDPSGLSSFWDGLKDALAIVAVVAAVVAVVAVVVVATVATGGGALVLAGGGIAAATSALTVAETATIVAVTATTGILAVEAGQNISLSSNEGSPQRKGTPRNNQAQNKQFRDAMKKAGIRDKEVIRHIHDAISGLGLTFHEIVDYAKAYVNFDRK